MRYGYCKIEKITCFEKQNGYKLLSFDTAKFTLLEFKRPRRLRIVRTEENIEAVSASFSYDHQL